MVYYSNCYGLLKSPCTVVPDVLTDTNHMLTDSVECFVCF